MTTLKFDFSQLPNGVLVPTIRHGYIFANKIPFFYECVPGYTVNEVYCQNGIDWIWPSTSLNNKEVFKLPIEFDGKTEIYEIEHSAIQTLMMIYGRGVR